MLEIQYSIGALAVLGFSEVERYEPGFFNNGLAIYQRKSVRIRLVIDRGTPSVEIARQTEPNDWLDLQLVMNHLDSQTAYQVYELTDIAGSLVKRFPELEGAVMLDFSTLKHQVNRLARERAPKFS